MNYQNGEKIELGPKRRPDHSPFHAATAPYVQFVCLQGRDQICIKDAFGEAVNLNAEEAFKLMRELQQRMGAIERLADLTR